MRQITTIPLSQLSIDNAVNVRKTGRGAEPAFVGSIRDKGVIEPLIVRKNGSGYKIANGGQRYAALQYMSAQGYHSLVDGEPVLVTDSFPVPVIVRDEDESKARETSLVTNLVRSAMHPVDEYEAFAQIIKDGGTVDAIAATYGLDEKRVNQRLALAKLSPKIRQAWRDNVIDAADAKAFTLAPDHKAMDSIFDKLSKEGGDFDADDIAGAMKINADIGRQIDLIGADAYAKRGGKVTLDLFGSHHRVSDEKLLKAMASEKLDAICEDLKKSGWSWAVVNHGGIQEWQYGRLRNLNPTTAERQRSDELETIIDDDEAPVDERLAAENDYAFLQQQIVGHSFSAADKAKSGCIVKFSQWRGLEIDYARVKPEEKKKVEAQERAVDRKKKISTAEKKGDPVISNALHQRMTEQLTAAAAKTLETDHKLALPAILAGFAAGAATFNDSPVKVAEHGARAPGKMGKTIKFASAFESYRKLSLAHQLAVLAEIAGAATDMTEQHVDHKPLKDTDNLALIAAMNATLFNIELRKAFDAKGYFDGVSKTLCLKAIEEAVNADEARKLSGKPKGDVAKFATATVPKTGWLPIDLRTIHYDGPARKAKAARK
jgi:ParB family transcriptional regulator, chromosome partitioning protein